LDSSLPSVNVGAGASISAQTSDNSDYDASQSLSKPESMSSEELFSQEPNEQNRMEWPTLAMMLAMTSGFIVAWPASTVCKNVLKVASQYLNAVAASGSSGDVSRSFGFRK